jgi:Leucine-rich repeat (LRR) protein
LQTLDISKTGINALNVMWFQKRNIEVLNISDNALPVIKKEYFKFLNNIRIFNASHNQVRNIEPNAFVGLKRLDTLILNNNYLTAEIFDSLENLRVLNLRQNFLSAVRKPFKKKKKKLNIFYYI